MLREVVILTSFAISQVACADAVTTTTTTSTPVQTVPATTVVAPAMAPAATTTVTTITQPVAGGYNLIDVSDQGVQQAAAFAVSQMQQGSLVKVESAQRQVVAGMNYKMVLIMDQNGVNYQYNVVVYAPLPDSNQPMQLTDVQAMGQVITAQPAQ